MKKNTTKVIKEANKYLVFQCILSYEPVTVEEIITRTSLSRPTVLEVIRNFQQEGLIVKGGYSQPTGGRPAELIHINKEAKYAVGIDFEFPNVRLAVANVKNEAVHGRNVSFELSDPAGLVLQRLLEEVECLIAESGVDRTKIAGIGMGISGTINRTQGKSLHIKRIKGWDHIDIRQVLEEKFGVPVYIKNDVDLLALIEKQKYLPPDTEDFAYIGIRSGIGSAIFYHNKPLSGIEGNAGYIGHTILNPEGPECACGNRGCLDAYSGEIAMNRRYRQLKAARAQGTGPDAENSYDTVSDFIRKAQEGDEDCVSILRQAAYYLGIGISNLVKTIEVETIVIGGCQNIKGTVFEEVVKTTIEQYLNDDMELYVKLHIGQLKEEEYPLGASSYVLEHFFEKPSLSLTV